MVDCRTMLSALVAAYDQHRKWMMADKFAALQRAVDHARDVLAQPGPAPAADGEVAELVTWLRREACFDSQWAASAWAPRLNRAADLLERQALRPTPVSERMPGPEEMTDDQEVWVLYPGQEYPLGDTGDYDWDPHKWILSPIEKSTIRENRRWLPAHALPQPEVNDD